jgi:hypothetical protein
LKQSLTFSASLDQCFGERQPEATCSACNDKDFILQIEFTKSRWGFPWFWEFVFDRRGLLVSGSSLVMC